MTADSIVPPADFTPYLLRQAGLRASLLQTSFGFAAADWEDLRQDLALDCLRRLPRFDRSRGNWQGFVRGVVRHHACVLASRQMGRHQSLETDADPDNALTPDLCEAPEADFRPATELCIDTQRVVAALPEDLRTLALYLAKMPISAVRRETGLTASQMNCRIRRIRANFTQAGLTPSKRGGAR